jgi:hypothetical protein
MRKTKKNLTQRWLTDTSGPEDGVGVCETLLISCSGKSRGAVQVHVGGRPRSWSMALFNFSMTNLDFWLTESGSPLTECEVGVAQVDSPYVGGTSLFPACNRSQAFFVLCRLFPRWSSLGAACSFTLLGWSCSWHFKLASLPFFKMH